MIGIIDYGMGNLRSVQKGLQRVGGDARILSAPEQVGEADKLVLPGVGAFGDAMRNLHAGKWVEPIVEFIRTGRPFLGVCLGLQLLFEGSDEDESVPGLGVLAGRCAGFRPDPPAVKVPHMGWNTLRLVDGENPLFRGLDDGCFVYFVHCYYAIAHDQTVVAARTEYGEKETRGTACSQAVRAEDDGGGFCSSVRRDNLFAVQFHPEKSQSVGLRMLGNFVHL